MESESSGEGIRLNIAAKRKKTYFWHIIQGFLGRGYFWPLPPFKTDAPHVVPPPFLKMKTLPTLKHKAPSRKWFLEKKPQISETH